LFDDLLENLAPRQRLLAKALYMNPTYLRMTGTTRLTVEDGADGQVIESKGLWEQMFLGNNTQPNIGETVVPSTE